MNRKPTFASRIAGLPQESVTWLSRQGKYRCFRGEVLPSYRSLTEFVRLMKLSADYLLCLIDDPIPIISVSLDNSDLWRRIGMSKLTNFSAATLQRIDEGYLPNSQILIRIAKEMNVSIDYLIGAERDTPIYFPEK